MNKWSVEPPDESSFKRILNPDGTTTGEIPSLSPEELLGWYYTLVLTREYEQKVMRMQRRGEISVAADSVGEEAVALGSAAALEASDWYYPSYRQTSGLLYLGTEMERILAKLMGAEPETINEHFPNTNSPGVTITPGSTPLAVNVTNAVGTAMVDAFVAAESDSDPEAVTMVYIGDGATSQGDFHEALNFAGVFDVPLVIICQNNQWAISVPEHRQTAADTFAQKGEAHGVPHERVDGNDVFAVYDAAQSAVASAKQGDGPKLIEAVTYRRTDHNSADKQSVYQSDVDEEYWQKRDPVNRFEQYLRSEEYLDKERIEEIEQRVKASVQEAVDTAREVPKSDPLRMFDSHPTGGWNLRHQQWELEREVSGQNPFTDFTGEEPERANINAPTGTPVPSNAPVKSMLGAIREGMAAQLRRDENVRLLGYDIGPIGGVFRATEGLFEEFGPWRIVDTPLSENGLIGTAVGMAMRGERPLVEIQFMGFLYPAFGQLMYTLSKMYERTAGGFSIPVTIRIPYGGGIKASEFHSESTETYLIHTPGIRVVTPSTPYEAKGLLEASVRCDDPVVYLEPKARYRSSTGPVPDEPYTVPLDEARLVNRGNDVTVICWGSMVPETIEAADSVDADVEIIDLRTLSPLDTESILASVKKTGRCVIVHEARRTLGLGAEIATLINEYAFDRLHAPVRRATGFDVHFPGHQIEEHYLPNKDRIEASIEAVMSYEF